MLFIGIAILIAAGLALIISTDAGSLVGLSQAQTAQVIPLVLLLIVFAGGMFSRRRKASELFGSVALWVGLFGVAIVGYTYRDELQDIGSRVMGELSPGAAVVDNTDGRAVFRRGLAGHFSINTVVNGAELRMIFDTGATAVVLTFEDARAAGIDTAKLRYNLPVATANGTGRAAGVTLDRIEVGGIVRSGIRAFIAEEGVLDQSLLGMTFLETLERYAVSGNALELVG